MSKVVLLFLLVLGATQETAKHYWWELSLVAAGIEATAHCVVASASASSWIASGEAIAHLLTYLCANEFGWGFDC